MGKENDLIKAVKYNDQQKLQKLLVPETPTYNIKRISREEPKSPSSPGGRIRIQLDHINVDCIEKETGYTPLIIAVLNENKDIADTLIFHCVDVNAADRKGNTALHYAVFAGKAELVESLLNNGCQVNKQNSDGNTALHLACQSEKERRVMVMIKLLKNAANVFSKNKTNSTPLDIAATYGKKDAVSVLLDHDSSLNSNTSAIIEAAIRGYTEIVHLLLDYGVNANSIDASKGTGPLHEATRFLRYDVAVKLVEYGASPLQQNLKSETPMGIVESLPEPLKDKFSTLFKENPNRASLTPRYSMSDNNFQPTEDIKDYPLLPTRTEWTRNTSTFCNSCTAEHPNTNILDGNLQSFWVIESSEFAWTVLDLQTRHTITGITIYGWDSKQMVKRFELQRSPSVHGPWITVGCFECQRLGSKSPKDKGVAQTFKEFTASSRYWRFHILENFGGSCTCFQEISLYGADDGILKFFNDLNLHEYANVFIEKGYNTMKRLLLIPKDTLKNIVDNSDHHVILQSAIEKAARQDFQLRSLKWKQAIPCSAKEGEILPDIIVKGEPGCRDEIQICFEDSEQGIKESNNTYLEFIDESHPSVATFSGISLPKVGSYRCCVRSVDNPDVQLSAQAIVQIRPKLSSEMQEAFNDMEKMLLDMQVD